MTHDLYPLAEETMQALSPLYAPALQQARTEAGFQGHEWGVLILGAHAGPNELNAEWLKQMWGYVPSEQVRQELEGTAKGGFIEPFGESTYRITESGRQALDRVYAAVHEKLGTVNPLPQHEMQRIAGLLKQVVDAALAAPEPTNKRLLEASRRSDPGEGAAPATLIDQYITDIANFRDGAHLAAWQPSGLDGTAWEALTLIWREQANSLETLTKQLERRSTTFAPYRIALADLVQGGLITENVGQYHLTESGRALREEAEDETIRLAATPWSALSDVETEELHDLLSRLRESLQQPNEQAIG